MLSLKNSLHSFMVKPWREVSCFGGGVRITLDSSLEVSLDVSDETSSETEGSEEVESKLVPFVEDDVPKLSNESVAETAAEEELLSVSSKSQPVKRIETNNECTSIRVIVLINLLVMLEFPLLFAYSTESRCHRCDIAVISVEF